MGWSKVMREFAQALDSVLRRRWRTLVAMCVGLAVGAVLLSAYRSGQSAAVVVAPYPHDLAQVSFAVAGDVIPHEAVKARRPAAGDGEPGWAALFSDVADVFEGADFGFVNLETPVAPTHSHGTKAFLFDAPVELPEALKASGIKIVSFANNHVMDQGWAGFEESREHLKEIGPGVCGDQRRCGDGVAAGDHRGERDQGGLAGDDALAEWKPESRQGRSAAREFLPVSGRGEWRAGSG
jgi:poly-gamma-glutamate capsule biosynthesis protein CapA/YwtB (metallophosphatase superfamily)